MLASQIPAKVPLPFANSGTKNAIPTASQIGITAGAASLTDGFPPLTFTPLASGGVPPAGADFNGILNMITAVQQWQCAGGIFKYDATFSTSIGGYPKGATLCSASNDGYWLNLADNNATNPDATDGSAANWAPVDTYGTTAITGLTNANVTLTPLQSRKGRITLAGTLTGNVQIIFPTIEQQWQVENNTTGAFSVTVKTAAGTGIVVPQGVRLPIFGDGTNINAANAYGTTPPQFDNSSLLATMAALQRAGWAPGLVNGMTGGTVLTTAHSGKICMLNGTPGTITLPASTTFPADRTGVIVLWASSNGWTLNRAGSDVIYMSNLQTPTSVALNAGDTLYLVSDGGTGWVAFGGSAQLLYSGLFAADLVINGIEIGRGAGNIATNTTFGDTALDSNTTGSFNTALGLNALTGNTIGASNTAVGASALQVNSSGGTNTAVGGNALGAVTTGSNNTAVGNNAGNSGANNLTTGSNDTLIGFNATPSAVGVNNEITLGNSAVATLRCQVTSITALSDARDKKDIAPLAAGLDFVQRLKPVSYVWNMRDGGKVDIPDTGFIAQELKQVQIDTGIDIPGLVYEENPEKLEAAYGKLLPVLVKAIQELSDQVAVLKSQLNPPI